MAQLKFAISVSVVSNSKETSGPLVDGGPVEMNGAATVLSMTQTTVRARLPLDALSTAWTANVWKPSLRPLNDFGLVHGVAGSAPSSEQRYDWTSREVSEKVMEAVVLAVGDVG